MHDLRLLRESPGELREGLIRRGAADALPLLERAMALDAERRTAVREAEEVKAARNRLSADVARRKRAGEPADDLVSEGRALGDRSAALEARVHAVDAELDEVMLQLPNVTLADVPAGGEEANRVERAWGEPRSDAVPPHWETAAALGILDLERGAKVAGSGFVVFRRDGARLVRALMSFMLDLHTREHGYEEVWVPALVNRDSMTGTAQFPKFADEQYAVSDDGLYLIPTAEVPVTNLYRDEILPESELPRTFAAYSPCFRREAGSHGKDTRGLLRLHQFDKVELVRYCVPEESTAEHSVITRHAEEVLRQLELPYRVVLLAAGDTGFASARTYDLEVYAPGVAKWLEVSSSSTFTDFQARRAGIRYRPASGGKPRFVHTLNASGVAFPRVIAALLEHHYRPDGSVHVPAALRPYLGTAALGG